MLGRDSASAPGLRAVRDPVHARTHLVREPGDPASALCSWRRGPHREVQGRTPMMNGRGKSDRSVVPESSPNKVGAPTAEGKEGRDLAKGNSREPTTLRA